MILTNKLLKILSLFLLLELLFWYKPASGIFAQTGNDVLIKAEVTRSFLDSDDDGLTDYEELKIYLTDSYQADTDADGLKDGWEVKYGLNPLDPEDGKTLFDGYTLATRGEIPFSLNSDNLYEGFINQEADFCISLPVEPIQISTTIDGKEYNLIFRKGGDNSENAEKGVYCLKFMLPEKSGESFITLNILLPGGVNKEIRLGFLVLDYGYVYEKGSFDFIDQFFCLINSNLCPKNEKKVKDAVVILFKLNKDGGWDIWEAENFEQENPQITKQDGNYYYFIPSGKYSLMVAKAGYITYKGKEFTVDISQAVNTKIALAKANVLSFLDLPLIFPIIIFLLILSAILLIQLRLLRLMRSLKK